MKFTELWANGDALRRYNFSNKPDQWCCSKWIKVLKLNLEYETINFERSNKNRSKVEKFSTWLGKIIELVWSGKLNWSDGEEFLEYIESYYSLILNNPIVLLKGRISFRGVIKMIKGNGKINLNETIGSLKIRRQLAWSGQFERPYTEGYRTDG